MRIPAFAKTIRFKLTLWYAGLLILFVTLFVVGLNLTMERLGPPRGFMTIPEIIVRELHRENVEMLRNYSLIGLGGLLVLGAGGGYFLSRKMLKPVDRVSTLAARISSTNLKERINYHGPDDEIKRLADTFDDMLERLEGAFEAQKQFIQNASHELKTPIAIAQTNIEVTEMEEKVTVKEYKRLMEVLKLSLERMNRLSNNLLLLSAGSQDQSNWSVVDMASLLKEVAEEASAQATAAGVSLELEPASEEMLVRGDALYLKQAVINLVDNAIKYSKRGGWVHISPHTENSQLVIQVEDSGIGVSPADQQRIFDRFYRVEKSRSRAQGGSGLGLAIVKKIVEDHGGIISVDSTLGKGSTFRIFLPKYSSA
jgi:signal transduction histidine kinase